MPVIAASQVQRLGGVEDGFLVLLHVLRIGQRQALHHGQQADQMSPLMRPVLARTSSAASGSSSAA
jgi:hypothetical protein